MTLTHYQHKQMFSENELTTTGKGNEVNIRDDLLIFSIFSFMFDNENLVTIEATD